MGSAMQPKGRGEKIADVAYLMSFPSASTPSRPRGQMGQISEAEGKALTPKGVLLALAAQLGLFAHRELCVRIMKCNW
jgi:hypothetical protein